jgi:dTDP-4-amino-4,6-dideoxygalactose transaminase
MHSPDRKQTIAQLAVLGGPPLFPELLHVGRPNILDAKEFQRYINELLERKWLSNDGPLVQELEARFAEFLGVKHCIGVANATLGLQFVVKALGIRGKVVMPAFTFIATPHAVAWQGATPLFCDVLEATHTLDPQKVREAMSPEVGAIVGVHVWGRACEIDELQAIADEWNVPLIFDAAHALGTTYKDIRVGRFGNAEVFSLHATKGINGVEAGFITTDDDSLAKELRAVRNYGFDTEGVVGGLGINGKMHEICAAMALSNLPRYAELSEHNRRLLDSYAQALQGVPGIRADRVAHRPGNHHYAVFFADAGANLSRDELLDVLEAENVRARKYFWPGCHRSPPYSLQRQPPLPVTERILDSVFQLPTGMQLDEAGAAAIASCIVEAIRGAPVLREPRATSAASARSAR